MGRRRLQEGEKQTEQQAHQASQEVSLNPHLHLRSRRGKWMCCADEMANINLRTYKPSTPKLAPLDVLWEFLLNVEAAGRCIHYVSELIL